MEISKELKEKLEKAQSEEEVKKIIEESGDELSIEEMAQMTGGFGGGYVHDHLVKGALGPGNIWDNLKKAQAEATKLATGRSK